jgi:hypothetical protein
VQQIKCISVYNAENTQGLKVITWKTLFLFRKHSKKIIRGWKGGGSWSSLDFGIPTMFPMWILNMFPSSECVPQNVPNSITFYHIFFAQSWTFITSKAGLQGKHLYTSVWELHNVSKFLCYRLIIVARCTNNRKKKKTLLTPSQQIKNLTIYLWSKLICFDLSSWGLPNHCISC